MRMSNLWENFHFGVNYHFSIQNNRCYYYLYHISAKTSKNASISWPFKQIINSVCRVWLERTGLISLVQEPLSKGQTRTEFSVLSELTLQAHFRHTNIHNGVTQQLLAVQRVAQWAMKTIKGSNYHSTSALNMLAIDLIECTWLWMSSNQTTSHRRKNIKEWPAVISGMHSRYSNLSFPPSFSLTQNSYEQSNNICGECLVSINGNSSGKPANSD